MVYAIYFVYSWWSTSLLFGNQKKGPKNKVINYVLSQIKISFVYISSGVNIFYPEKKSMRNDSYKNSKNENWN